MSAQFLTSTICNTPYLPGVRLRRLRLHRRSVRRLRRPSPREPSVQRRSVEAESAERQAGATLVRIPRHLFQVRDGALVSLAFRSRAFYNLSLLWSFFRFNQCGFILLLRHVRLSI